MSFLATAVFSLTSLSSCRAFVRTGHEISKSSPTPYQTVANEELALVESLALVPSSSPSAGHPNECDEKSEQGQGPTLKCGSDNG
jgi:hypothetical protein